MAIPLPPPFPNRSDNPPNFNDLAEGYFAWLDNEGVPGINQVAIDVEGSVLAANAAAGQAGVSRDNAVEASDQARMFRDSAQDSQIKAELAASAAEAISGPTYPDTESGLTATVDGESFAVSVGDGLVSIYLNSSGTAVLQRELATSDSLMSNGGAELMAVHPLRELLFLRRPV